MNELLSMGTLHGGTREIFGGAKPPNPRAEARTEEGAGKLTPLQRPYRPY